MNARRSFLKNFGVVGAISAVALAAHQYNYEVSKPELTDEDIKHLAPQSSALLTITADNRTCEEKEMKRKNSSGIMSDGNLYHFSSFGSPTVTHQVSMSVGKDDRLWLKIGDKWKRVALDTKV
jgi:hypothetical protein